jgi:hypothetical protein
VEPINAKTGLKHAEARKFIHNHFERPEIVENYRDFEPPANFRMFVSITSAGFA